jgi:WD40 repeat protein
LQIGSFDGSADETAAKDRETAEDQNVGTQSNHIPSTSNGLVVCSLDGSFFVTADKQGRLKYCRTSGGSVVRTFYHCSPKGLVFSKDGSLLASAGGRNYDSGTIKVWRVADGALLCRLANEVDETHLMAFATDGRLLASSVGRSRINLWEIGSGKLKWSVPLNRSISSLMFSADGKTVIAHCVDQGIKEFMTADGEKAYK